MANEYTVGQARALIDISSAWYGKQVYSYSISDNIAYSSISGDWLSVREALKEFVDTIRKDDTHHD